MRAGQRRREEIARLKRNVVPAAQTLWNRSLEGTALAQPWRIEMFGGLKVRNGDFVVSRFKTHKTGALLAFLAFHCNRAHTREALIDMLWPDSDLTQGRPSLSVALSSLRHQLEPPGARAGSVLLTTTADVRINPDAITSDMAEFEALLDRAKQPSQGIEEMSNLTRAVEVYGGDLLPGYYEDWCLLERNRLQRSYIQALRRIVRRLVKDRALTQAIVYAEKAVAADPQQEELHRDLIQLYAASGHPTLALRQYRELERRLQEDLGGRPSAITRRLVQEIEARKEHAPETAPARTKTTQPASTPTKSRQTALADLGGIQTFLLATPPGPDGPPRSKEIADQLRAAARTNGGRETLERAGSLLFAFARAADAQACAIIVQRAISDQDLIDGCGVSLVLHTGEAGDESAVRVVQEHLDSLASAAHPGQILCSEEAAVFLRRTPEPGISLVDLGRWRLPNSAEPARLFALTDPNKELAKFPPPRAETAHTVRIPLQFTRFFGRESELTRIAELLASEPKARTITLTGPGGTGKTRLAIEAARRQAEAWRGAVWFVSLAHTKDADAIVEATLDALGATRSGAEPPLIRLRQVLERQPSLLVLDNLEQVVEPAATVIGQLLESVPNLTCLVTSRQKLQIAAERELPVSPLSIPDNSNDLAALAQCESVSLFVDCAQAVRPDFQVTRHNAGDIAELCRRLEGLPLALELAAARAQALTPAQMVAQLDDRFAFLTSRRRDLPERHRMLRTTVDWSYQLLVPPLQRLFAALSVFHDGFTAEAAVEVCEEEMALDAICQLQECSLVLTDDLGGALGPRFRMLKTIQAFGAELLNLEERVRLHERHASYFVRLAESAGEHLAGPKQAVWLSRLDQEYANLCAALEYLLDSNAFPAAASMCAALSDYWERRGRLRPAISYLQRCLGAEPPLEASPRHRRILSSAGWFAYLQGRYQESLRWQERCLKECQQARDEEGECLARNNLGLIEQARGRLDVAAGYFARSLEIARNQGDKPRQAARLSNLGLLAIQQGELSQARASLEEALSIYRSGQNDYGIAACLCNIAKLAIYEREYDEALVLAAESLSRFREAGDRSGIAYALANLGLAKTMSSDHKSAVIDLRGALAICRETGLHSLAPILLETLARNDVHQSRFAEAAFALAAAERLRSELATPRSAFEDENVTSFAGELDAASAQELRRERVLAASVTVDQLFARILENRPGDSE